MNTRSGPRERSLPGAPSALPLRVRQFLSFAVVGVLATGIQFLILIAAVEWLGHSATLASAEGFTISAAINYLINYHFTFRSSASHAKAVLRFATIAGGGLLLTTAAMWVLTTHTTIRYVFAQILTSAVVLVWNFCGNAFWSFAEPKAAGSDTAGE